VAAVARINEPDEAAEMVFYTINVAQNGQHLFATAERSIPTLQHCRTVLSAMLAAFPSNMGYSVTVSEHTQVIRCVDVEILLPTLPPFVDVWPADEAAAEIDPEACPGCGCKPGDGYTAGCNHSEGCGFYKGELSRLTGLPESER
jgi:hypothetical protein